MKMYPPPASRCGALNWRYILISVRGPKLHSSHKQGKSCPVSAASMLRLVLAVSALSLALCYVIDVPGDGRLGSVQEIDFRRGPNYVEEKIMYKSRELPAREESRAPGGEGEGEAWNSRVVVDGRRVRMDRPPGVELGLRSWLLHYCSLHPKCSLPALLAEFP